MSLLENVERKSLSHPTDLQIRIVTAIHNQKAGQPRKLATDFLQLIVLHKISKKNYIIRNLENRPIE